MNTFSQLSILLILICQFAFTQSVQININHEFKAFGRPFIQTEGPTNFFNTKLHFTEKYSPNWFKKEFNSEAWAKDSLANFTVRYYRLEFHYTKSPHPFILNCILFDGNVFLNGVELTSYSKENHKDKMTLSQLYSLNALDTGQNIIAIQSHYSNRFSRIGNMSRFEIFNDLTYLKEYQPHLLWELFYAGLAFMSVLISFILYRNGNKEKKLLYFIHFCLSFFLAATSNLIIKSMGLWTVGNDVLGSTVYTLFNTAFLLFGLRFIAYHLDYVFNKNILIAPFLIFSAHVYSFPIEINFTLFTSMIKVSVIIPYLMIILSTKLKKYRLIQYGVVGYLISFILEMQFYNHFFSQISIVLMLVSIVVSTIKEMDNKRILLEEKKNESYRLEIELLKKNIQPHYLMNSLESIIAWLDENPSNSAIIIEQLAFEFRTLNEISNQKLIPFKKEFQLCESHLKIMSLRKDKVYRIYSENIPDHLEVPPLIIHTLIENGVTHSGKSDECSFYIYYENTKEGFMLSILNVHESPISEKSYTVGLGLKYIHARLTESYQDHWKFASHPVSNGWKTTIKIQT